MGTDPWAEERWDSDHNVLQFPLPISLLRSFSETVVLTCPVGPIGPPVKGKRTNARPMAPQVKPGILLSVDKPAWQSWEEEFSSPDPAVFLRTVELVIDAEIRVGDFSTSASVLVDTGSRIPLLFRKGLIPFKFLEKAQTRINIVTADGTPMVGGTRGCKMEIILPISGMDGSSMEPVCCQALWGYESAIRGSDLILGYPFLKIFRLVVDCPSDCLKSMPTSKSASL